MYFPLSYGRLLRGYVNDIFEWTSNAVMFSKPNQPTDHTRHSLAPPTPSRSEGFSTHHHRHPIQTLRSEKATGQAALVSVPPFYKPLCRRIFISTSPVRRFGSLPSALFPFIGILNLPLPGFSAFYKP